MGGVELRWPLSKVGRGHRLDDFSFFESTHIRLPRSIKGSHASRSRGEHVARPELWRTQGGEVDALETIVAALCSLLKTTVHSLVASAWILRDIPNLAVSTLSLVPILFLP